MPNACRALLEFRRYVSLVILPFEFIAKAFVVPSLDIAPPSFMTKFRVNPDFLRKFCGQVGVDGTQIGVESTQVVVDSTVPAVEKDDSTIELVSRKTLPAAGQDT